MIETLTNAEDLFGELSRENKTDERKIEFDKNESLEILIKGYEVLSEITNPIFCDFKVNYCSSISFLKKFMPENLDAKNIQLLAIHLGQINENFGTALKGSYLSACINHSGIDKIEINTKSFQHRIDCLGVFNEKAIIEVNGDLGHDAGIEMGGGKLIIRGNVGNYLGTRMHGGEICLYGISENNSPTRLKPCIGQFMNGGIIRLYEKFSPVLIGSNMTGGKIYYKDLLIMEAGGKDAYEFD